MNIIADIAGQYDALLRLVDKMPKDEILLLGDMVDRGPNSKEVIQWAIDNEVKALLGNHEHMMLDYYENIQLYDQFVWISNGGGMTVRQYKEDPETLKPHLEWLKNLPLYHKQDNLLVTHAAWSGSGNFIIRTKELNSLPKLLDSVLWSRGEPEERDFFQVFGHNSQWGLRWFGPEKNPWAVCLDDSRKGVLTGLNWNNMKIYQEPYIKETRRENECTS